MQFFHQPNGGFLSHKIRTEENKQTQVEFHTKTEKRGETKNKNTERRREPVMLR